MQHFEEIFQFFNLGLVVDPGVGGLLMHHLILPASLL